MVGLGYILSYFVTKIELLFLTFVLPAGMMDMSVFRRSVFHHFDVKTSNQKGNDRSIKRQQVKSSNIFKSFQVREQGFSWPIHSVSSLNVSAFKLLCMSVLPATLMII